MNIKKLYWLSFFLTVIIYAIMLFWSLPIIVGQSGGLLPFDLRVNGYSLTEAKNMLNALSPEAIEFYKNIQAGLLDMIFPALLFLTISLAYWLLAPSSLGNWRFILIIIALVAMIFDYLENFTIINMLGLGAGNINDKIVNMANFFTLSKLIAVSLSLLIILLLLVYRIIMQIGGKNN